MNGNKLIEGITSESVKKLNPELFSGAPRQVGGQVAKPVAAKALGSRQTKQRRGKQSTIIVNFISLRKRPLDDDNNIASFKPLRDAIAEHLCIDDADPRIKWEYGQCLTTGQPETIVRIEMHQ